LCCPTRRNAWPSASKSPFEIKQQLESLLELAQGTYPHTTNEREGIVIRPREETMSAVLGGRLSFKVISNRFLLKEGD
jgi:hypothetical protein